MTANTLNPPNPTLGEIVSQSLDNGDQYRSLQEGKRFPTGHRMGNWISPTEDAIVILKAIDAYRDDLISDHGEAAVAQTSQVARQENLARAIALSQPGETASIIATPRYTDTTSPLKGNPGKRSPDEAKIVFNEVHDELAVMDLSRDARVFNVQEESIVSSALHSLSTRMQDFRASRALKASGRGDKQAIARAEQASNNEAKLRLQARSMIARKVHRDLKAEKV